MRTSKRSLMMAVGLAGVALSAAACAGPATTTGGSAAPAPGTGSTSSTPAPNAGESTAPAASPDDNADESDSSDSSDSSGGSGSGTSGGGGGGSTRCHSGDLKVSTWPDEDGGMSAGHLEEALVFTNTSGSACTMEGYPGVSFVTGDDGKQVGSAFERTEADTPSVRVAAGDRVHATIRIAQTENFDAADCKPVETRGFRIYPPDETAAIFVAEPRMACSVEGVGVGEVKPMAEGEG